MTMKDTNAILRGRFAWVFHERISVQITPRETKDVFSMDMSLHMNNTYLCPTRIDLYRDSLCSFEDAWHTQYKGKKFRETP